MDKWVLDPGAWNMEENLETVKRKMGVKIENLGVLSGNKACRLFEGW